MERVGRTDNFFDLGGDSILALRLVGVGRLAGLGFSVADVFRARTLADLAELVTDAADTPEPVALFSLVDPADRDRLPDGLADAYPLTMLQAGMLHEMLADHRRGAYHNVTDLKITVPEGFDAAAFQSAVDAVVAAHPILRTSVDLVGHREPPSSSTAPPTCPSATPTCADCPARSSASGCAGSSTPSSTAASTSPPPPRPHPPAPRHRPRPAPGPHRLPCRPRRLEPDLPRRRPAGPAPRGGHPAHRAAPPERPGLRRVRRPGAGRARRRGLPGLLARPARRAAPGHPAPAHRHGRRGRSAGARGAPLLRPPRHTHRTPRQGGGRAPAAPCCWPPSTTP